MDLKSDASPTCLWDLRERASPDTVEMTVLSASDGSELIVPLGHAGATAAPLVRVTGAQSRLERLARRAAWIGVRSGLARPLLRRRIHVVASRGSGEPTLHEYIAHVLDEPRVDLAVSLGPPRINRKPVITVMSRTGKTLAVAKVGWNDLTRDLVMTEARFLASEPAHRLRRIAVARILHLGTWRDNRVSVMSPLLARPGRPAMTAEHVAEVARLDGTQQESFQDTETRRRLESGLTALGSASHPPALDRAWEVVLARWSDLPLEVGRWHGDWSPWNAGAGESGRLILWDWERTRTGVPVGFDVLHLQVSPTLERRDLEPSLVLPRIRRLSRPILEALGVSAEQRDALLPLYLLEIYLRHAGAGPSTLLENLARLIGAATR